MNYYTITTRDGFLDGRPPPANIRIVSASEFRALLPPSWPIPTDFGYSFTNGTAIAFIALADETPVGYIVGRGSGNSADIDTVHVVEAYRRQGIGRALLKWFHAQTPFESYLISYIDEEPGRSFINGCVDASMLPGDRWTVSEPSAITVTLEAGKGGRFRSIRVDNRQSAKSMTQEDLAAQLLGVASALNAEQGEAGYFRGVIRNTPFLFKLMSSAPPAYSFKLRMVDPHTQPSDWRPSPPEEYANARVDCELVNDYVWLFVGDASSMTSGSIASLVSDCAAHHASYFPTSEAWCFDCCESGQALLVQAGDSVALICRRCLAEQAQEEEAAAMQGKLPGYALAALLPLALLASAAGWALFWVLYDGLFGLLKITSAFLPRLLVFMVVFFVGYALGWPVGKVLGHRPAFRRFSPGLVCLALTATAIGLGELMTAAGLLLSVTSVLNLSTVLQLVGRLLLGGGFFFVITKLVFGIGLWAAMRHFASPKERRLAV